MPGHFLLSFTDLSLGRRILTSILMISILSNIKISPRDRWQPVGAFGSVKIGGQVPCNSISTGSSRAIRKSPTRGARSRPPARPGPVPAEVDVLIVGCGPAGLTLAAQLSAFPDIKTCIVEQKDGPLLLRAGRRHRLPHHGDVPRLRLQRARAEGGLLGQRDDVLEAGSGEAARHIVRSGRVQDVEDGLSEFPHVVLNQARVHDFYLDVMRNRRPARAALCAAPARRSDRHRPRAFDATTR